MGLPPTQIVVADTSPLINFLAVDRMDLLAALSSRFLVTPHVSGELNYRYPDQLARYRRALAQRAVEEVTDETVEELTLFSRLHASGRLGAGECSAIAVAVRRGHALAIDDKRATAEARRQRPELRVLTTQSLVVQMIHESCLDVTAADELLKQWRELHSFVLKITSFADLV